MKIIITETDRFIVYNWDIFEYFETKQYKKFLIWKKLTWNLTAKLEFILKIIYSHLLYSYRINNC